MCRCSRPAWTGSAIRVRVRQCALRGLAVRPVQTGTLSAACSLILWCCVRSTPSAASCPHKHPQRCGLLPDPLSGAAAGAPSRCLLRHPVVLCQRSTLSAVCCLILWCYLRSTLSIAACCLILWCASAVPAPEAAPEGEVARSAEGAPLKQHQRVRQSTRQRSGCSSRSTRG